jgi:hypothetical protein
MERIIRTSYVLFPSKAADRCGTRDQSINKAFGTGKLSFAYGTKYFCCVYCWIDTRA